MSTWIILAICYFGGAVVLSVTACMLSSRLTRAMEEPARETPPAHAAPQSSVAFRTSGG